MKKKAPAKAVKSVKAKKSQPVKQPAPQAQQKPWIPQFVLHAGGKSRQSFYNHEHGRDVYLRSIRKKIA